MKGQKRKAFLSVEMYNYDQRGAVFDDPREKGGRGGRYSGV